MKLLKLMNLAALCAVSATSVHADIRRPLVDSTGVLRNVVATQMPGLTVNDVRNIAGSVTTAIVSNTTNSNIPPGYTEVSVPMGPRDLGNGTGTYGTSYYAGLGYPFYSGANNCAGNPNPPRVIQTTTPPSNCNEGGCQTPASTSYFVCEPVGTRTSLQKVIGGQTLFVNRAMLDAKTIFPAVGMSTNATTAYCQFQGYVNYVPGTVVSSPGPGGSCDNGSQVTRWNGSAFYNDQSCYNNVLQSLQCFK